MLPLKEAFLCYKDTVKSHCIMLFARDCVLPGAACAIDQIATGLNCFAVSVGTAEEAALGSFCKDAKGVGADACEENMGRKV